MGVWAKDSLSVGDSLSTKSDIDGGLFFVCPGNDEVARVSRVRPNVRAVLILLTFESVVWGYLAVPILVGVILTIAVML